MLTQIFSNLLLIRIAQIQILLRCQTLDGFTANTHSNAKEKGQQSHFKLLILTQQQKPFHRIKEACDLLTANTLFHCFISGLHSDNLTCTQRFTSKTPPHTHVLTQYTHTHTPPPYLFSPWGMLGEWFSVSQISTHCTLTLPFHRSDFICDCVLL